LIQGVPRKYLSEDRKRKGGKKRGEGTKSAS